MKLSEIRQVLAEHEIQLTKSLGQNFLHDANQLRRIVEAAELSRQDKVLEIGPGLGPLTALLVRAAGYVLAIEKDARLVRILRQRFGPGAPDRAELCLVEADALVYLKNPDVNWTGWKLVANLPYSVASPILVELACRENGPARLVATLQLEVAKRLLAHPGTPDYGLLTLLVQLDYQAVTWFKIPAGCFFPEPEVDSACAVLRRRSQPLLRSDQRETFSAVLKRSFSQRRKMMAKLLKADWPADTVEAAFASQSLSRQVRAETVTLEQFAAIATFLHERRDLRYRQ